MGQGTKRDIMLPVGWPWAPLTIVWRFVVMKKWTLASQECLESSSNEGLYNPEWPQKVFWDSENKALKLIWKCWHDKDSAEILGKPSKIFRIRETLTLSMCADSRTKSNPIWHIFFGTFGHFFPPFGSIFLSLPMERLRAIARTSWSPVPTDYY